MASCDESRCVSRGKWHEAHHHGSFTCWGDEDGTWYPMVCADGYQPKLVETEPASVSLDWKGETEVDVRYFTCCPPEHNHEDDNQKDNHGVHDPAQHHDDDAITRHCAEPLAPPASGNLNGNFGGVCNGLGSRRFPRPMETNRIVTAWGPHTGVRLFETESVLCCDNALPPTATHYLDETECLDYRNEFYETTTVVENRIGSIRPRVCEVPGFGVPRPWPQEAGASAGRYRCCRSESPTATATTTTGLSPFVEDSAFYRTLVPLLLLWIVAAVASIGVVVGLLVPYLRYRKHKRSSVLNRVSQRSRGKRRSYSTYNLYLVYLAGWNFVYSLYSIALTGSYLNQSFHPNWYGGLVAHPSAMGLFYASIPPGNAVTWPYVAVSMWIHAVIAYQVLVLLQSPRRSRRIHQPSLQLVNLQMGVIGVGGLVMGCALYGLSECADRAGAAGAFGRVQSCSRAIWSLPPLVLIPPLLYILFVMGLVWYRGFLPSRRLAESVSVSVDESEHEPSTSSRGASYRHTSSVRAAAARSATASPHKGPPSRGTSSTGRSSSRGINSRGTESRGTSSGTSTYSLGSTSQSSRVKTMREIALYFFRIVATFLGLWFPAFVVSYTVFSAWGNFLSHLLLALQPTITTLVILTHADARKYMWDLVTLACLRKQDPALFPSSNHTLRTSGHNPDGTTKSTKSNSGTGVTFAEASNNSSNADIAKCVYGNALDPEKGVSSFHSRITDPQENVTNGDESILPEDETMKSFPVDGSFRSNPEEDGTLKSVSRVDDYDVVSDADANAFSDDDGSDEGDDDIDDADIESCEDQDSDIDDDDDQGVTPGDGVSVNKSF